MIDHELQAAWDALHHHERASKRRCPDAGDTLWCGPVGPEGDSEPRVCSDPGCMHCLTHIQRVANALVEYGSYHPCAVCEVGMSPGDALASLLCDECKRQGEATLHERIETAVSEIALDMECYEVPGEVIEQWASTCRCCSACWEFPCAACCAGGVCDDMPCRCDDDSHDGPGDEGYFPEEDERC